MLGLVILSLSLSLDLCSHIFCSYYLYVRYGYYNGSIFGFSNGNCAHLPVTGRKQKTKQKARKVVTRSHADMLLLTETRDCVPLGFHAANSFFIEAGELC